MQAMAAQAKTHPSPTRSTVKTQENIMIMIMHSTAQHLRKSINSIMKFSQIDESPSLLFNLLNLSLHCQQGEVTLCIFMEHILGKGVFFAML
jgi:hypothetical protein